MIEDREERMGSFFHATIQFNVALPETVCSVIQEDSRVSHITALCTLYSILCMKRYGSAREIYQV